MRTAQTHAFTIRTVVSIGVLALLAALPGFGQGRASPDDLTQAIGLAYQYALPVWEVARIQYELELYPSSPRHLRPNHLFHQRNLATPKSRLITGPNADTLYSISLVDLRGGPVRIDVPEMADRYYSIMLVDEYTNDFAYVGRRTTGTHAGSFLLEGPQDPGAPNPEGSKVIRAPTPDVVLLLRVLVHGPQDLDTARRLQDGFTLTPTGSLPPRATPPSPFPDNGENFVAVVNDAMARNPPPAEDAPMLDIIGKVGIGPRAVAFTPELRRAWNLKFAQVKQSITYNEKTVDSHRELVNGWLYPLADQGRFGTDYESRASVAAWGLFANLPEENTSCWAYQDNTGSPIDGGHRYVLHLPAQMPLDAFWSLSVHRVEKNGLFFVDSPIHRWSINPFTPGLRRNADGSLDILIQRAAPEKAWMSNWLPIPDGRFHITLRNYQPRPELLNGSFRYPAIQRVD